jgi:DNA-binding LacI/PurR family transcriptional regulator
MPHPMTSATAAYARITADLRRRLDAGEWPAGTRLPALRSLAQHYRVSLRTLQRAVQPLVDGGSIAARLRTGLVACAVVAAPALRAKRLVALIAPTHPEDKAGGADRNWEVVAMAAAQRVLAEQGLDSRCWAVHAPPPRAFAGPGAAIRAAAAAGAAGILAFSVTCRPGWLEDIEGAVASCALPTVLVWECRPATDLAHVVHDQWADGFIAGRRLLSAGYARILGLCPHREAWAAERMEGLRAALACAKRELALCRPRDAGDWHWYGRLDLRARCALFEPLLRDQLRTLSCTSGSDDLALVVSSDHDLAAVLQVLGGMGIRPGEGCGLVSFDDSAPAQRNGITSLRPPLTALGEEGARQLAGFLLRHEALRFETRYPASYVPRRSTRALA